MSDLTGRRKKLWGRAPQEKRWCRYGRRRREWTGCVDRRDWEARRQVGLCLPGFLLSERARRVFRLGVER